MALTIIGHRGIAGHYPENTMASLQAAIELGLEWIEFDVQPTKDGQLVICHDHTIDRCSNGFGRVDDYTLEQLQQFDFGGWFSPEFNLHPISSLEQLLAYTAPLTIKLNIELKIDTGSHQAVVDELKRLLNKYSLSPDRILISSFDHLILRTVYESNLGYPIAVLTDDLTDKDWLLLDEINAVGCNLYIKTITPKQIEALKSADYKVWCFTVNRPEQIDQLSQLDGIFSDYPERFLN